MSINLEDLGIGKEELTERVVESIADRYVNDTSFDEDGNPGYTKPTKLAERLKALVAERIDAGLKKVMFRLRCQHSPRSKFPFWAKVRDEFCIGSTSAGALCRWAGYDPDTGQVLEESQ